MSLQPYKNESASIVGMKSFLRLLPDDELFGLLKTTTAGLVEASSTEDAIRTIVTYSDPVTLLNRRKLKKEYLINYLHSENVKFSISADKSKLCRAVLYYWGDDNCRGLKFVDTSIPKESKPQISSTTENAESSTKMQPLEQKPFLSTVSTPQSGVSEDSKVALISNTLDLEDTDDEYMDFEESVSLRQNELQQGQLLAEQFAKWFYDSFNGLLEFGPSHFWLESNLRIEFLTYRIIEIKNVTEAHDGPSCFQELCQLRDRHKLYFNPNLIPRIGVRGKINPHGLAQVIACGTLLKSGKVFGIFEQVFFLIMDPAAGNNYKIKNCLLKLRDGGYVVKRNNPPALCDSSLAGLIDD